MQITKSGVVIFVEGRQSNIFPQRTIIPIVPLRPSLVSRQKDLQISTTDQQSRSIHYQLWTKLPICTQHYGTTGRIITKNKAEERTKYTPNHLCNITTNILLALQDEKHTYIQGEPGLGKPEVVDTF